MLLRAKFDRGSVFLYGIEYQVRNFKLDVPANAAIDLVLRGNYTPFTRYRKLTSKCKKILIIRGSGLGDVLMCHPIRKYIKNRYPGIELHFATDRAYSCVLDSDSTADRVYDHSRAIAFTFKEKYDLAINLNNMEFGNNRISTMHKIDLMASGVGIVHPIENKKLFYKIKQEEIEWAAKRMVDNRKKVSFILASTCASKHMKPELIIKIIKKLTEHEVLVYIFDKKKRFGKSISKRVGSKNVINCCGRFNVRECAAIMNGCNLIFTPDTGFMHLGIALGKKVLAYFGSMGSDVVLTPGNVFAINKKGLDCQPCNRFNCPKGTMECLKFNPDRIVNEIIHALGE